MIHVHNFSRCEMCDTGDLYCPDCNTHSPAPGASGCYADALWLLLVVVPLLAVALGVAVVLRRAR